MRAPVGPDGPEEEVRLGAQRAAKDPRVDHLYEAAPKIGLALTGFRHDETLGNGVYLPIHILRR